jgi:multiple sugar transport system substrate-binding protein
MKRLRVASIMLGVLMLALALVASGCGSKKKSSAGGGGGGKTLAPKDAKNAKGTVSWCIGKDTTGAFAQMIKLHNDQGNGVTAKLIELPAAADQQRTQQIQRLRAKSSECDVLGIDPIWMAEYVSHGWVYDLTKVVDKRKDDFIPSTVESAKYNGKYWAIPFNTNAGFLYYRSDQVSQAPSTWEQVYSEAKQDNGLVYQSAQYEGLTVNFLELLYSAGGKVLSDDGKKSAIDSKEAKDALTFMANGYKDGAVPKANLTYMEEESRRAFEAGQATFMRNWPYAYALGLKSPIKGKFKITTLPGFEGHKASGVIGGYNLAVNAYSKHPEAALEFADFITQPEPEKIMASKASLPPTLSETYDDPTVKQAMPFASELRTAIEQAHPRPISPVYTPISEAIYKNVYAALAGRMTPDAAISKMNDQINNALSTF